MIRYKNKIYWDYFIHPETGMITDKNGNELVQRISNNGKGYYFVVINKEMLFVHRVQAHTYYGWRPNNDVHHRDENRLNNDIYNLDYSMTRAQHVALTQHGKKGRIKMSDNFKKHLSIINAGENNPFYGRKHKASSLKAISKASSLSSKGRHWYNNGIINVFKYECPSGFIEGMIKRV